MEESLFLLLFPIAFILIGIYLLYYSACLLFNKSWIDIENGLLKISHKPIPWWRGNKSFEIDQIKQVYVKQKTTKSKKNGVTFYYHLRAKLHNEEDVLLFDIDETESAEVMLLETKIEEYLGIKNKMVKGEYLSDSKMHSSIDSIGPREPQIKNEIILDVDDQIKFKNHKFKVVHRSQYDWSDGNSDWQFQIVDEDNNPKAILIEQNKGLLEYFLIDELNILASEGFNFTAEDPPSLITHKDEVYNLTKTATGNQFRSDLTEAMRSKKWSYRSVHGAVLSILKDKDMITYYVGNQVDTSSLVRIKDGLELKPIKEKLRSEWKNDDLV